MLPKFIVSTKFMNILNLNKVQKPRRTQTGKHKCQNIANNYLLKTLFENYNDRLHKIKNRQIEMTGLVVTII